MLFMIKHVPPLTRYATCVTSLQKNLKKCGERDFLIFFIRQKDLFILSLPCSLSFSPKPTYSYHFLISLLQFPLLIMAAHDNRPWWNNIRCVAHSSTYSFELDGRQTFKILVTSDPLQLREWINEVPLGIPEPNSRRLLVSIDVHWPSHEELRLPGRYPGHPHWPIHQDPAENAHPATISFTHPRNPSYPNQGHFSCVIFQLRHAPHIPQALHEFLYNPSVAFVGTKIHQKMYRVFRTYNIVPARLYDLSDWAIQIPHVGGFIIQRSMTIRDLLRQVLPDERYQQPAGVGASDWAAFYLSAEQIVSVAVDSYWVHFLAQYLRAKGAAAADV